MTSAKQVAANQANAQRSTGPKTDEGKAASRMNAITHGMTAEHPDVVAKLNAETAELQDHYAAHFGATTPLEIAVMKQLAMADLRMDRCWYQENTILGTLSQRAEDLWDIDREAEVAELALKLVKAPNAIHHKLLTTAHGCDWLIAAWEGVVARIDANLPFDASARSRALDLLGTPHEWRDGITKLDPAPGSGQTPSEKAREIAQFELSRLRALRNGPLDSANDRARSLTIQCVLTNPPKNLLLTLRYEREAVSRHARLYRMMLNQSVGRDCPAQVALKSKPALSQPKKAEVVPPKPKPLPSPFPTLAAAVPVEPKPVPVPAPQVAPRTPKVVSREEAPGLNRHQRQGLGSEAVATGRLTRSTRESALTTLDSGPCSIVRV